MRVQPNRQPAVPLTSLAALGRCLIRVMPRLGLCAVGGGVAQLGERLVRNQKVGSSSLLASTSESPEPQWFRAFLLHGKSQQLGQM